MIYAKINSCKMRSERVMLCCILIITTMITFSNCTTTETSVVTNDRFDRESQAKIIKIILKNGIVINCEDKIVRFENNYDMSGDFIISSADTLKAGTVNWKDQRISGTDIQKILIQEENVNTTKTILIVSGLLVLAAVVFLVLIGIGLGDAANAMTKKFSLNGLSFK